MKSLKPIMMLAAISTFFAASLAIEINFSEDPMGSQSIQSRGYIIRQEPHHDEESNSHNRGHNHVSKYDLEKLQALELENRALQAQSSDLRSKVGDAREENIRIIQETSFLSKMTAGLPNQIEEKNSLVVKAQEVDILVNGLKYQIDRLSNASNDAEKIKQTLATLEKTKADYKHKIAQLESEIAQLESKIHVMEEDVHHKDELVAKIADLRQVIEAKEDQIVDFTLKIKESKKAEDEIRDQTGKKINEIDDQIGRKKNLVGELFAAQQLIKAINNEKEEVNTQINTKTQQAALFQRRAESIANEIDHLNKLIERLTSETSDRDELIKQAAKLHMEIRALIGSHGDISDSGRFRMDSFKTANGMLVVGSGVDN